MRTALVAGASGLVGQACLRALLQETTYGAVVALVRRPLGYDHPKLRVETVDFANPSLLRPVVADDAFCAIGTTIAKAGSHAAFRAVDYLGVLTVADLALAGGARQFILVSSVGADPQSGNFYLAVKGEAEVAVQKRPFASVLVVRPGLLLGRREESRPLERLMQAVFPVINPLLAGSLRKYRAIEAERVGQAMVAAALKPLDGRRLLQFDEINELAAAARASRRVT